MGSSGVKLNTGQGRGIWPVLLVLLAAALVPAACVLWFMNAAMRNERLAVREKLMQAYTPMFEEACRRVGEYWLDRQHQLNPLPGEAPPKVFERLVKAGIADGVIVYDAQGDVLYPDCTSFTGGSEPQSRPSTASAASTAVASEGLWEQAAELEFAMGDFQHAAAVYQQIATSSSGAASVSQEARALLAQARCLARDGRKGQAIEMLASRFGRPGSSERYSSARDVHGRLVKLNAQLMAMELIGRPDLPQFRQLAETLWAGVAEYGGAGEAAPPSSQRRFLMLRLTELDPNCPPLPTLQAEMLSWEYLSIGTKRPGVAAMKPAAPGDMWSLPSANGGVVALIGQRQIAESFARNADPAGAAMAAVYDSTPAGAEWLLSKAMDGPLSGWRYSLRLEGDDPFAAAADRQNSLHLWTGMGGILFIAILAVALATYLGRQIKLTRLKNDLIATVSHELKTPLASMRVLVDTLREGRCTGADQAGEYFDLIARENQRLSRLIDNFLTFSRMERNKRAFEFNPADIGDVIRAAVAAVGERFTSPAEQLEVIVAPNLPQVWADHDAIVTVVLNLLDNAWKYSGEHKNVKVRAFAAGGSVCIAVADNGVGMSRRASKRIFDKFYQVDQTLSRKAGGCGLGLSIVKFILDAHDGTIRVKSQPGKGSTFTVRLPAETARQIVG